MSLFSERFEAFHCCLHSSLERGAKDDFGIAHVGEVFAKFVAFLHTFWSEWWIVDSDCLRCRDCGDVVSCLDLVSCSVLEGASVFYESLNLGRI